MGIVLLGGAVRTAYQWRHKILTLHSARMALFTGVVAGIVAALIAACRLLR